MTQKMPLNRFLEAQIQKYKKEKEPSLTQGLEKVGEAIIQNIRKARLRVETEERALQMQLDSAKDRKASEERVAASLQRSISQLKATYVDLKAQYDSTSSIDKGPELCAQKQKYFSEVYTSLPLIEQERNKLKKWSEILNICAAEGVVIVRQQGSFRLCLLNRPDVEQIEVCRNVVTDKAAIEDGIRVLRSHAERTTCSERTRSTRSHTTLITDSNTSGLMRTFNVAEPHEITRGSLNDHTIDDSSIMKPQTAPWASALAGVLVYSDSESTSTTD